MTAHDFKMQGIRDHFTRVQNDLDVMKDSYQKQIAFLEAQLEPTIKKAKPYKNMKAQEIADDVQQTVDGMSNRYRAILQHRIKVYGLIMFAKGIMGGWFFGNKPIRIKSEGQKRRYELVCQETRVFVVDAEDEEDAMLQVVMNTQYNITAIDKVNLT